MTLQCSVFMTILLLLLYICSLSCKSVFSVTDLPIVGYICVLFTVLLYMRKKELSLQRHPYLLLLWFKIVFKYCLLMLFSSPFVYALVHPRLSMQWIFLQIPGWRGKINTLHWVCHCNYLTEFYIRKKKKKNFITLWCLWKVLVMFLMGLRKGEL